ncbi:MAG: hypothetical protein M1818_007774 [Claussenomyces sp. TS43310]|nr:MAG: hypothetical protein M1818_007774 [Claussenomyces sp. TS43310]
MTNTDIATGKYDTPQSVTVLPQTPQLLTLLTILRDTRTSAVQFALNANRVARQLVSEALNHVPTETVEITTPTGSTYLGCTPARAVCGISILRAGASLEQALRDCWSGSLSFGKILIQRDETTCLPAHLYSKYPQNLKSKGKLSHLPCFPERYLLFKLILVFGKIKVVLLLEPMLATGGSACLAIELITAQGVPEENIIFVNFVASRQGIDVVTRRFPRLAIVTAAIDEKMNEKSHVVPGLGDFGDRFYGTEE